MISDDKVGPGGVKVRCKKCGHVTHVPGAASRRCARRAPGARSRAEWWVAIDDQPVGPVGDRGGPAPLGRRARSVRRAWSGTPGSRVVAHLRPFPSSTPTWAGACPSRLPSRLPRPRRLLLRSPTTSGDPGAASALAALEEPGAGSALSGARPGRKPFRGPHRPRPSRPPTAPSLGTDPTGVVPLPMAGLGADRGEAHRRHSRVPGAAVPAATGHRRPDGEPIPHRGPSRRAGGRGRGRGRPLVDDEVAGSPGERSRPGGPAPHPAGRVGHRLEAAPLPRRWRRSIASFTSTSSTSRIPATRRGSGSSWPRPSPTSAPCTGTGWRRRWPSPRTCERSSCWRAEWRSPPATGASPAWC